MFAALAFPSNGPVERRRHPRFPIDALVRFFDSRGCAQPVMCNLSTGGIFLNTTDVVAVGETVRLSIDWPTVGEQCPLQLVIEGFVVRSGKRGMAVAITKYDFRTCNRASQKTEALLAVSPC